MLTMKKTDQTICIVWGDLMAFTHLVSSMGWPTPRLSSFMLVPTRDLGLVCERQNCRKLNLCHKVWNILFKSSWQITTERLLFQHCIPLVEVVFIAARKLPSPPVIRAQAYCSQPWFPALGFLGVAESISWGSSFGLFSLTACRSNKGIEEEKKKKVLLPAPQNIPFPPACGLSLASSGSKSQSRHCDWGDIPLCPSPLYASAPLK